MVGIPIGWPVLITLPGLVVNEGYELFKSFDGIRAINNTWIK
jgi:hypothetical protein